MVLGVMVSKMMDSNQHQLLRGNRVQLWKTIGASYYSVGTMGPEPSPPLSTISKCIIVLHKLHRILRMRTVCHRRYVKVLQGLSKRSGTAPSC